MEVARERGREILARSLPPLISRKGFRTVTDTRHRLWFDQRMGHWKSFPIEVRKLVDYRDFKKDYLHVRLRNPEVNPN